VGKGPISQKSLSEAKSFPLLQSFPKTHSSHTQNSGPTLTLETPAMRGAFLVSAHRTTSELRTICAVAVARGVSVVLRLLSSESVRRAAGASALCVGLAVQVGLCFLAMYLIDLSVSLFELWADLARKHLELTL
jgi:hypothetical protein